MYGLALCDSIIRVGVVEDLSTWGWKYPLMMIATVPFVIISVILSPYSRKLALHNI